MVLALEVHAGLMGESTLISFGCGTCPNTPVWVCSFDSTRQIRTFETLQQDTTSQMDNPFRIRSLVKITDLQSVCCAAGSHHRNCAQSPMQARA
jgi:hypothetical protein